MQQLLETPYELRNDKTKTIGVLLPDSDHWTRVRFWGVKSVVGFRYGREHHAIAGAFTVEVPKDAPTGACSKAFEAWADPWVRAFEVEMEHEPPQAVVWRGDVAEIDSLVARTATLAARDEYAAAYGSYPAWPGTCLIVGVAVPARGDLYRAKAVRDRFVKDVLPKVEILSKEPPKELY